MSPRKSIVTVFAALLLFTACSDGDSDNDSADESVPEESVTDPNDTVGDDADPDGDATDPVTEPLTPQGLGTVSIGSSEDELTASGAVSGEWAPNCEISGGGETFALLAAPIIGQVYALDGEVSAILVLDESVATEPGGVKVGTDRDEASDAFAAAGLTMEVDESTAETFGEFFWSAQGEDGAVFGGSIDPDTGAVTAIATPTIPVCE